MNKECTRFQNEKKKTNELKQSLNEEGAQTCELSQYNLKRTVNFQKKCIRDESVNCSMLFTDPI